MGTVAEAKKKTRTRSPRTPEGIARANARRKDTKRPRTPKELEAEAEAVGMHFQWSAPEGRYDLVQVGWILRVLASFPKAPPVDAQRLKLVRDALYDLCGRWGPRPYPERQAMVVSIDAEGARELAAAIEEREKASRERRKQDLIDKYRALGVRIREDVVPPGVIDFVAKRQELLARRGGAS